MASDFPAVGPGSKSHVRNQSCEIRCLCFEERHCPCAISNYDHVVAAGLYSLLGDHEHQRIVFDEQQNRLFQRRAPQKPMQIPRRVPRSTSLRAPNLSVGYKTHNPDFREAFRISIDGNKVSQWTRDEESSP